MSQKEDTNVSQENTGFPEVDSCQADPKSGKRETAWKLSALSQIYRFIRSASDDGDEYLVAKFLKQEPEESINGLCAMLNDLADTGSISFHRNGEICEDRIDINADPIIANDISFRMNIRPDWGQLEILRQLNNELEEALGWKRKIENRIDDLEILKKESDDIMKVRTEVRQSEAEIKETEGKIRLEVETLRKNVQEDRKETIEKAGSKAVDETQNEIDQALKRDGVIGSFLQDIQKDLIQYMAIFIAVFSLINLNIGGTEGRTLTDYLGINLLLVSSIVTLFALLFLILRRPLAKGETNRAAVLLWVAAILLWMITVVVILIINGFIN